MDDFERMVQLAEFGANRHDERRQVEFRVFISYITLLALALYQVSKPGTFNFYPWLTIPALSFIHAIYLLWQIRLSRALVNDAVRRNFYLKKAECILHHLWEKPNSRFSPRPDRFVKITLDYKENKNENQSNTMTDKISEYELFKMHEPAIETVYPMRWCYKDKHWDQIYNDWSRPFATAIPSVILILLIAKIIGESLPSGTFLIETLAWLIAEIYERL